MGWLYMRSLGGHSGPQQYLDAQFTYTRPHMTSKVLRSALSDRRVYYAAVEHVLLDTGKRDVFAVVCLVHYNPRDKDGYVFGYKDMDETVGPCESDCPASVLDLLTPIDAKYALDWRARCRENLAARRARTAKPGPRAGQVIVFDQALRFSNGLSFDRMEVVANPRGRGVLFRAPDGGGLYRITNVKSQSYRLLDPQRG